MSISDPNITTPEGTVEHIGYLPGKNIDECERTSPSDCSNCSSPALEQHSPDSYRSYSPQMCLSSSPPSHQSPAHSPHSLLGTSVLRPDASSSPLIHDRISPPLLTDPSSSPMLLERSSSPLLTSHPLSPMLTGQIQSPLLIGHPSPLLTARPSPMISDHSSSPTQFENPSSSLLTGYSSPLLTFHSSPPLLPSHSSTLLCCSASPLVSDSQSTSLLPSSQGEIGIKYELDTLVQPKYELDTLEQPKYELDTSEQPKYELDTEQPKYELDTSEQPTSPPRSPSPELPSLSITESPSVSIHLITSPLQHDFNLDSTNVSMLPTSSHTSTSKLSTEGKTRHSSIAYGSISTSPRSPKFPPPPPPPLHPLNHSQNFEDPCSLRLSPSSSPPISFRKPFYSLSPKSERSDTKSPFMTASSSSSPLPNFMEDVASTSENAPVADPPKESRLRPISTPTEVVDVDQSQPCIVDLTCEDDNDSDDDVEIVSADQPVVFLSESNSRRRNRKRKRHDSQRASTSTSAEEPIVINDTIHEPSSEDLSTTVINVSDSPINIHESSHSDDAVEDELMTRSLDSRHHGGQLFGDLLDQSVVSLDHGSGSGFIPPNRGCTCYPPPDDVDNIPFCEVHHQFSGPSSSSTREGLREERSRSPIVPPATPPGPHQPPNRSVLEAPIPQDVLDDIASLYADGPRRSLVPYGLSLFRRLMRSSPDSNNDTTGTSSTSTSSSGSSSSSERRVTRSSRQAQPRLPILQSRASSSAFHPPVPQQQQQQQQQLQQQQQQQQSSSSSAAASASASAAASVSAVASTSSTSPSEDSGALSCPICFESFQDIKREGRSLSSTVCGHIFCTDCLEASFRQAKQCPTCRKRISKKQYHPLYI